MNDPCLLDRRSFLMAFSAEEWYLERRNSGVPVLHGENVMVAMTITAMRRKLVTARDCLPVKRFCMLLLLGRVATAAIDRLQLFIVGEFFSFEIRVAGDAAERCMDRSGEFLFVDKDGGCSSPARARQSLVLMACQTLTVFLSNQRGRHDNEQSQATTKDTDHVLISALPPM